jgi:hypothetical protein
MAFVGYNFVAKQFGQEFKPVVVDTIEDTRRVDMYKSDTQEHIIRFHRSGSAIGALLRGLRGKQRADMFRLIHMLRTWYHARTSLAYAVRNAHPRVYDRVAATMSFYPVAKPTIDDFRCAMEIATR